MNKYVTISSLLISMFFVSVSIAGQAKHGTRHPKEPLPISDDNNLTKGLPKCAVKPGDVYQREEILKQLSEILNDSVPQLKSQFIKMKVQDGRGIGFFVFDLTNPSNKQRSLSDCVEFIENHVYHFAPRYLPLSFSHILHLDAGRIKVFKSINCNEKGTDKIEDVLNFMGEKLKNDVNKDDIIKRIKNYREFGSYGTDDVIDLECRAYE